MWMKPQELNDQLQALAHRYAHLLQNELGDRLVAVALFGSVARHAANTHSDIDLFVVIRDLPAGAFRRRTMLEPVRQAILPELETLWQSGVYTDFVEVIRTPEEAQRSHLLYLDMMDEALLLYDRGHFLADLLSRFRRRLEVLGARRRQLGNITYWDIKPDFVPGENITL
jgi:uncharacterized protein